MVNLKKAASVLMCGALAVVPGGTMNTVYVMAAQEDGAVSAEESSISGGYVQDDESLKLAMAKWNYDEENDVYWQIGVNYCSTPETEDYETMGIYVPGKYMNGEANGDGTYTCTIDEEEEINGYTASTAPIVFPVNTAGYSAQAAPGSYSYQGLSGYLDAGFIYVYAGMRGRDNGYDEDGNFEYSGGAPWGVTDLKAAVRYYRYNADSLPGNTDSIFTFGHSGGGAQSAVMGASGDSTLYDEYLETIGAAMYDKEGNELSDAICGAMCWCPITSLDYADEAYEWNLGQYSDSGTRSEDTWTSALSEDLAEAYAEYINELGLKDEEGNILILEPSEEGVYAEGSYYDYIMSVIEESLNNFLSDTEFPYTSSSGMMRDGGFAGAGEMRGEGPGGKDGGKPDRGEVPDGGEMPGKDGSGENTTYETVQDYIDSLNEDDTWVVYDEVTNTASVTNMEAFVRHCKNASKSVGAFDDTERSQAENKVFGNDGNNALHFDSILAQLLEENQEEYASYSDWDASLSDEYLEDLEETDKMGTDSATRQNMYNPMYYLSDHYEGYGTSAPASYWRINTGIEQGDTALTVETNLALTLEQNDEVKDVEFATVWGQGHTTAERTGDSTGNFIQWVNQCVSGE
ncbi:MAG: subtype A tannase [Eubacteriales bacterium]|nr:subtype A tannase [Eubacteriales bacterium]